MCVDLSSRPPVAVSTDWMKGHNLHCIIRTEKTQLSHEVHNRLAVDLRSWQDIITAWV